MLSLNSWFSYLSKSRLGNNVTLVPCCTWLDSVHCCWKLSNKEKAHWLIGKSIVDPIAVGKHFMCGYNDDDLWELWLVLMRYLLREVVTHCHQPACWYVELGYLKQYTIVAIGTPRYGEYTIPKLPDCICYNNHYALVHTDVLTYEKRARRKGQFVKG